MSGWDDLRAGRWADARGYFEREVERHPSAKAYEGLSWATWWLDDAGAMFDARERAFRLYREAGDAASAARMATWLAADQLDFHGAMATARGWIDRAARLLEPLETGPAHGWLAFQRAWMLTMQGERDEAERHAARAAELGRRFGVPDLEMLGLAVQGSSLVARAQVGEGMRRLDEASAMALADEATIPISGAWTCCFLVTACIQVLDFERAFEWCDRIAQFADRYGSRYMLGFCQAEYATIHLWRGDWRAAERALETAIEALSASRAPMVGGPTAELAELRRRQGRTQECEDLLAQAGSGSAATLCRAELALDRGEPERAAELSERVLRGASDAVPLVQAPALGVLARALLASDRLDDAAGAVERLSEIAELAGTTALGARATLLRGMLAAARHDNDAARTLLEDAIDAFERCRARFDVACARRALAGALAALGRARDAEREERLAQEQLRQLGAVATSNPAASRTLPVSPRERDVLALLTEGLTNREIAGRLHISEHTVHRHMTSILRKLDVPSRAAAAAIAVEAGLGPRAR